MSGNPFNKKHKKPHNYVKSNPGTSESTLSSSASGESKSPCPLLAKDSTWVDILDPSHSDSNRSTKESSNRTDDEELLQLVESEDGPQLKPLAVMFPGLLNKDPQTLKDMVTHAMSTTEVTKHLVDLGQKADFTCMKKADRLIPRDKQWMERLTENSNSYSSVISNSSSYSTGISIDYDASSETTDVVFIKNRIKKKRKRIDSHPITKHSSLSLDSLDD